MLKILCGGSVIAALLFLFVATPYIYELRININKYTHRNITQNIGIHKAGLIVLQKLSQVLPEKELVDLQRSFNEVGIGAYSNTDSENYADYKVINVTSSEEIINAIQTSLPGSIINILPGEYFFTGQFIHFSSSGNENAKVILRAENLGDVIFNSSLKEGILITASHIEIENIVFKGARKNKVIDTIHHAIHLVGNADHISISHNEFINFNAHIKSNGKPRRDENNHFPDFVTIENNNFYNQWKRNTSSPASPIDIVGGDNWLIINNFIADFGKNGRNGKGTTYGIIVKGAGKNAQITNNLVACQWKIPHSSPNDVRIGITLGNGGTGKKFCMDNECKYEHYNGVILKNAIINCKNDVGIYINKGLDTFISNNYIANSLGIEIRFPESTAIIQNNYLDGRVSITKGASSINSKNRSLNNFY